MDSGAVDTVGNPNEFLGATIKETRESKDDERWISANGDEIPKLGEMDIKFQTSDGQNLKMKIKAGEVSKTLISVSRLLEAGFETNLSKRPYIRNSRTGQIIKLKRKGAR